MVLCFQEGIVVEGNENIVQDASSLSSLNSL